MSQKLKGWVRPV